MNSIGMGIIIGLSLLILFCTADYKKRIGRSSSSFVFYSSLFLFLALNIAFYWLLCWLLLDNYPTFYLFSSQPEGNMPDITKVLTPVAYAIMYFGTGAATFRFKNFEFNAYAKIVEAFQQLFRVSFSYDELKRIIKESQIKQNHYKRLVERLNDDPDFENSFKLQEDWSNTNLLIKRIGDHRNYLDKIRSDIDHCPEDNCRLKNLSNDIGTRKIDLANEVITLYQTYLKKFIEVNNVDRKKILNIIIEEKIPIEQDVSKKVTSVVTQTVVSCFFAGLFLGPVFKAAGEEKEIILYSARGALSLSMMGLILSYHFKTSGLLLYFIGRSAIAGYFGYFIISIKSFRDIMSWTKISELLLYSIKGIPYGISIGLSLYFYSKYSKYFDNRIVSCMTLALTGGILLNIAYCFFNAIVFHLNVFIFGAIANVFIAWGLGLYEAAKTSNLESQF
jgi:hypothetical protein